MAEQEKELVELSESLHKYRRAWRVANEESSEMKVPTFTIQAL